MTVILLLDFNTRKHKYTYNSIYLFVPTYINIREKDSSA